MKLLTFYFDLSTVEFLIFEYGERSFIKEGDTLNPGRSQTLQRYRCIPLSSSEPYRCIYGVKADGFTSKYYMDMTTRITGLTRLIMLTIMYCAVLLICYYLHVFRLRIMILLLHLLPLHLLSLHLYNRPLCCIF